MDWSAGFLKDADLVPFIRRINELWLQGYCVLWGTRVIFPEKLRMHILKELHSTYGGISRMKALARSYVFWCQI